MRTSIVIDYQNLHMVGWEACRDKVGALHECLIHPLAFANELLRVRNANQRPGFPEAVLSDVWVYRGLPQQEYDPKDNSRNLAHQAEWEKDRRVHVTLRPLRYVPKYEQYSTTTGQGRGARTIATHADGRWRCEIKREKGVDVLCALAVLREAQRATIDLVILASHDTDLEPALEEAQRLGQAKIETMRWNSDHMFVKQLKSNRPTWNTALNKASFEKCIDQKVY